MNLKNLSLERFEHTGQSFMARVSISKYGLISFNDGARRRFNLDGFEFAILHYAKLPPLVAVQLTNDSAEVGALVLRKRETGAYISAKSFVEYYDLGIDKTQLYPLHRDEETGMLYWLLEEGKERISRKDDEVTNE